MHNRLKGKASVANVFVTFLRLGLTSFGGPIAHIGYFRHTLVKQRQWVSEEEFAQLLALCQFLPGPASSQLGFVLGYVRAGWMGALAAFCAFTLPSVALLLLFVQAIPWLSSEYGQLAIQGLKLVACVVVADAVTGMWKKLCASHATSAIALATCVSLLLFQSLAMQLAVIIVAAMLGAAFLPQQTYYTNRVQFGSSPTTGLALLGLFATGLVLLPLTAPHVEQMAIAQAFFFPGALVFGGGHVVLPLLQETVVNTGWIDTQTFLSGYGATQALPGPLFSFSAYLGALLPVGAGVSINVLTAVIAIFLPGFLLVAGILPFWRQVLDNHHARRAMTGVNACVVGILLAALIDPIIITGISGPSDAGIVLLGLIAMRGFSASPLMIVLWCVFASVLGNVIGLS